MQEFNLPKVFNWQKSSKKIVKKYVADLYQSGTTAPVATVLYNDTDVAFTFEYISAGTYAVTSSKPLFTDVNGQFVQASISNATFVVDATVPTGASITVFPVWNNVMMILVTDLGAYVDNLLGHNTQNALEVTIYA